MYIMCVILCLLSALGRRLCALQMFIISIMNIITAKQQQQKSASFLVLQAAAKQASKPNKYIRTHTNQMGPLRLIIIINSIFFLQRESNRTKALVLIEESVAMIHSLCTRQSDYTKTSLQKSGYLDKGMEKGRVMGSQFLHRKRGRRRRSWRRRRSRKKKKKKRKMRGWGGVGWGVSCYRYSATDTEYRVLHSSNYGKLHCQLAPKKHRKAITITNKQTKQTKINHHSVIVCNTVAFQDKSNKPTKKKKKKKKRAFVKRK